MQCTLVNIHWILNIQRFCTHSIHISLVCLFPNASFPSFVLSGDMGFEGDMMDDDHLDDGLYVKSDDPSSLLLEGAAEPDQDSHHPMDMDFDGQERHDDTFASPMHDDYGGFCQCELVFLAL